ncbi:MAG: anthranilate phosphoribosyltransferase, partial [Myxococcota bacterium]
MVNDPLRPRDDAERRMAGYLARIATGPELSKDLSLDEARDGMELILRGAVDASQAAVFLIALRMKRESDDELAGALAALRGLAECAVAEVDDVVDMAEPYNGYVRHLPAGPFVPAVLASCGVPCALHGIREIGPKWGVTAHRILHAAGVPVDHSAEQAARALEQHGWAYVDLPRFCAPLDQLSRLRTLIVKRPCLSLLEKLITPVRARGRTHLWVGYAHRGYPQILAALARRCGYHSMLAVRGVEGGVLTSLTGRMRAARFVGEGALEDIEIAAGEIAPRAAVRAPTLPKAGEPVPSPPDQAALTTWAEAAARSGQAALAGESGPTRDILILGAAAMLRHLG